MASLWLVLDTAGPEAVVGVVDVDAGSVLRELWLREPRLHAERLPGAVAEVAAGAALSGIGAGTGPGSFIGVRTGLAFAKGLGRAWNVPVVGVPSLWALASSLDVPRGRCVAVVDAKRGERYAQVFDSSGRSVRARGQPQAVVPSAVPGLSGDEFTDGASRVGESTDGASRVGELSTGSSPGGDELSTGSSPGGDELSTGSSPGGDELSTGSSPGGDELSTGSSPGGGEFGAGNETVVGVDGTPGFALAGPRALGMVRVLCALDRSDERATLAPLYVRAPDAKLPAVDPARHRPLLGPGEAP